MEILTSEIIELHIGDQIVRPDRERTVLAYRQIELSWADVCRCTPCRNFVPQREAAFSSAFVSLLSQLGIKRSKESEIYGCYPMPSGKRSYGGWFFLCGELVKNGNGVKGQNGESYYFRGPGDMPAPGALFEPKSLILEFEIELLWILDEDPDELYGPAQKSVTTEKSS